MLAVALSCVATPAGARSAADLSARLQVDGAVGDWDVLDRVFDGEERDDDSAWSALQELVQIDVTWDAQRLYVAVTGRLGGHALVLYIDHRPGGLEAANGLEDWRRALHFGPELRPDAFLAVRDGQAVPELYLVAAQEALQRVPSARYTAAASFASGVTQAALEASIGWDVLFPGVPLATNPDTLAPSAPMFVLPATSAAQGLRLAAVLVHADAGLGAADVAPDASVPLGLDARAPASVDRAVRVDWGTPTVPAFVKLGFAFQEQPAPRFVPDAPSAVGSAGGFEMEVITFRAGDASMRPTRLVVPDRALALGFALAPRGAVPALLFVTATVASLAGERVAEVVRDAAVQCGGEGAPCSDTSGRFVWDGRDSAGRPVRGGTYVLRLDAGTRPGTQSLRVQRTIAVVH